MPNIKFNTEVSITGLITILTLIVSLAGGWALLSTNVKSNADRIAALELRTSKAADDDRTAQLELVKTLTELQTDVRYLRQAVDTFTKQQGVQP